MWSPQLSNLSCPICQVKFERKSLLDEHMESHSSSKQLKKKQKNYCHVCQKSFKPESYKLHVHTEDQFQKIEDNDTRNLFTCENGFVLLSKKKINKNVDLSEQQPLAIETIKTEVADSDDPDWSEHREAENKKNKQKEISKAKSPKCKCLVCGILCKGEKGLKIHMNAHKRRNSCNEEGGSNKNNNINQSLINNNSFSNNPPVTLNKKKDVNLVKSVKPKYINISEFQNQSNNVSNIGSNSLNFGSPSKNLVNSANQFDEQSSQSLTNQTIQQPGNIMKFDSNSKKYAKWLENFTYTCKMLDFPLPPTICKNLNKVTEELSDALGSPEVFFIQKAKHVYFIRTYETLSEIKLKHLQHVIYGTDS